MSGLIRLRDDGCGRRRRGRRVARGRHKQGLFGRIRQPRYRLWFRKGRHRDFPGARQIEEIRPIHFFLRQPFAQARIIRQAVRDEINPALKLAPIDHATAFLLRQCIKPCKQSPVDGRARLGEQVYEHRPARGDFARLKRARAFVAFQIEKLKPVRKGHSVLL